MIILGISSYFHDSSACLIKDGKIIAAIHEERFTRVKHDNSFPINAIKSCLEISNIDLGSVDFVVFFEKPFIKFERIVEIATRTAPFSWRQFFKSMPLWIKYKLFQKRLITNQLQELDAGFNENNLKFSDHHLSHAASAFFASPFRESVVITMDGVGEWATTTLSYGFENTLDVKKEIRFPHSLGLLYSAFTYFCGFKVNSGEYKLMGLAPYGKSKYKALIKEHLIDIKGDGSFRLNMKYFTYLNNLQMTGKKFEALFGVKKRDDSSDISQVYMDLAASIQSVLEEVVVKLVSAAKSKFPNVDNLCLAGGVALNCVANGKIHDEKLFKNIWIQPASGDAGGSLGAALAYYFCALKKNRQIDDNDLMQNCYLGRSFSDKHIKDILDNDGWVYTEHKQNKADTVSDILISGKVLGRFVGREEYGPRALGNRSILADPTSAEMQRQLNMKIKFREGFRPFAPIVKYDKKHEWFEMNVESKYMLITFNVNRKKLVKENQANASGLDLLNIKRSLIPAVTHVDNSARVQTVRKDDNHELYEVLSCFERKSGCPVLINTSFNVRGEPIVGTPHEALFCFMATDMDALQLGSFILLKEKQSPDKLSSYAKEVHERD